MNFKQVFVKPGVVLGDFNVGEPKPPGGEAVPGFEPNLGPSGPHQDDDEEPQVGTGVDPGGPPIIGEATPHYTNTLDALWVEFDDPEERTAARLIAVIDTCADEAVRVHQVAVAMFEEVSESKVPEAVQKQYQAEFTAYARRMHGYKERLLDLEPTSLDTDEVYLGLIKRKAGAGPVPDAIMHLYFANQIGILADHAHDMGKGFVGRLMTAVDAASVKVVDAAEVIEESGEEAKESAGEFWEELREMRWWILGGIAATVGTSVGIAVGVNRLGSGGGRRRE